MDQEIKEHKSDGSSGPISIDENLFLQLIVLDLIREDVSIVFGLSISILSDQIGYSKLEFCHDFSLLLFSVSSIIVSDTVKLNWRTESDKYSHVFYLSIGPKDLFLASEEGLDLFPFVGIIQELSETKIDIRLSCVLQIEVITICGRCQIRLNSFNRADN